MSACGQGADMKETTQSACQGLLTWKALLAKPSPSCRHTTMASTMPQFSPHTVPHTSDPFLFVSTSTRPSKGLRPPLRRSWGQGRGTVTR